MAHRCLFKNFWDLRFGQGDLEVFAETHELPKVYFVHDLLQVVKLPVLRNVLSAVEMKDLLQTPLPQLLKFLLILLGILLSILFLLSSLLLEGLQLLLESCD